ncbi:MAG: type II toxin-antitoxin system RelE/ParE family toxin [Deltaproteobacteria bacterium]|nr:type II toxin-antitoxin system RelE/ParE family toxin [Deltaproteobacteria bacterium]
MKQIDYYKMASGREPCRDWLNSLDMNIQQKIYAYIVRAAQNAAKKNIRTLGDGIFEIKINTGSGYRVYFGNIRNVIILLLVGGDKNSQFRDIMKAKEYWREYVSKQSV